MANSKWPLVEANFKNIKLWCKEGLSEKQICSKIGIGKSTFERYKKEHPELLKVLQEGKKPFIEKLENALAKRALGYEYKEEKTYIKKENGKDVVYQEITTKHMAPSVQALVVLIFNKDKDEDGKAKWTSDPAKRELEALALQLKKDIEDLKSF